MAGVGGPLGFGAVPTGIIPTAVASVSTALDAALALDRTTLPITTGATAGPGGALPFTGVDLSLLIATALLALVAGTALAASTRRRAGPADPPAADCLPRGEGSPPHRLRPVPEEILGHRSEVPRETPNEEATMAKAVWNDEVIAESDDTVIVEGNHYFPRSSVRAEFVRDSDTHSVCPWKGTASYESLEVDGATNEDALWFYPEPKDAAKQITDRVAFWKGVEVTA